MRLLLTLCLFMTSSALFAQYELMDIHDQIKKSQLDDARFDWKYFGTLNLNINGIDNAGDYSLETEENVEVRLYLVAKTDCIMYFTIRDKEQNYLFGTEDTESLRTILMGGHKVATAMHQFDDPETLMIRFGLRWGCKRMIGTEMKMLVFYKEN